MAHWPARRGFRQRPSQLQMALAVFESDRAPRYAGGRGRYRYRKTLAYLVPAVLAGGKVLISAGTKTLQDQIFDKDLPAVCRALGVSVDTAILKGRQNYVCRLRLERTAVAGMLDSLEDVRALQQVRRFAASRSRAIAPNSPTWSKEPASGRRLPPRATTAWVASANTSRTASWCARAAAHWLPTLSSSTTTCCWPTWPCARNPTPNCCPMPTW